MSVGKGNVLSSVYEWEIPNFSAHVHLETGTYITSPKFHTGCALWHLKLYPNGDDEGEEGIISLFLEKGKSKPNNTEIQPQFAFSIINAKNEVITDYKSDKIIPFSYNGNWGVSMTDVSENVKNMDRIMILCEVIVEKAKLYKTILTSNSDRLEHFKGYKDLIENPKFSDVKITVEGKEIPAHKIVLATSSEVFAAMFEHSMQENAENNVTIEDCSYDVFNKLLIFLYTGQCEISHDTVTELFKAADKYQLLKLKEICEEELCENVSVENAIALLQLADMHSAERLKKNTIEFVTSNMKEIVRRTEFDSIRSFQPELFKEIFEKIFDRTI